MGFGDLLAPQAPRDTAEFTLDTITLGFPESPVLIVRPIGYANAEHRSAMFVANQDPRLRAGGITAADASDEIEAELMARHVIVGWRNVGEAPGVAATFSPDKVLELLRSFLQKDARGGQPFAYLFHLLLSYARNPTSFRTVPQIDPVAAGKG